MISLKAKPSTGLGILFWLAVIIALVIFGPLATIWSVNTLFGTNIDYTFDTWVATVILGAFFNRTVTK